MEGYNDQTKAIICLTYDRSLGVLGTDVHDFNSIKFMESFQPLHSKLISLLLASTKQIPPNKFYYI
jgi:hypothetical protein